MRPPATQPPAPLEADLAPGGAVVFVPTPDALQDATVTAGNRFEPATSSELTGTADVPVQVRRWYTASAKQPELGASIAVDSFPAEQMSPDIPAGAAAVTVQKSMGCCTTLP